MTSAQHKAAGTICGLLVLAMVGITFDRPVRVPDSGGGQLPDAVGSFSGDAVAFCHNDQCLAAVTVPEYKAALVCPQCGAPLHRISLAEFEKLPADVRILKRHYHDGGRSYDVSLVRSGYSRRGIHRPEVCLVAQGYRIVERNIETISAPDGTEFEVARLWAVHDSGRALHYAYWFRSGEFETARHATRILKMGWDGIILNRRRPWVYMAISTRARYPKVSARGLRELRAFLGQLHAAIGGRKPEVGDQSDLRAGSE